MLEITIDEVVCTGNAACSCSGKKGCSAFNIEYSLSWSWCAGLEDAGNS